MRPRGPPPLLLLPPLLLELVLLLVGSLVLLRTLLLAALLLMGALFRIRLVLLLCLILHSLNLTTETRPVLIVVVEPGPATRRCIQCVRKRGIRWLAIELAPFPIALIAI